MSAKCAAVFSGNQVAQSVRASGHEDDTALSALHANAAWQQGVFAALVAVLDMCSSNSPVVDLQVTEMHVRLACRLLEINLNIRQAWRSQGDLSLPEERVPGDHIRYIIRPETIPKTLEK